MKRGKAVLPFYYSYNFQIALLFVLGAFFYTIFRHSDALLRTFLTDLVANDVIKFSRLMTYVCSISAIAMITLKQLAVIIWENSIKIYLERAVGSVEKYVRESGPLNIADCRTKEDFDRFSELAAQGMYGPHAINDESFYSFTKKFLVDRFACRPHPSRVSKKVVIRDLGQGLVEWRDNTEYQIHHVKFNNPPLDVHYDFKYSGNSYAPALSAIDWARDMKIHIVVGEEALVDQKIAPIFEEDKGREGFYCWKDGDWVCICYRKNILLEDEWTPVYIEEITLNSIEDKSFNINTTKATCNYKISVSIPEEFEFRQSPFVSSRHFVEGMSQQEKKSWMPKINTKVPNRIIIDIKGWVIPGNIINLNWVEKQREEIAEGV